MKKASGYTVRGVGGKGRTEGEREKHHGSFDACLPARHEADASTWTALTRGTAFADLGRLIDDGFGEDMNHDKPLGMELRGTPVSSGIAIGKVYLLERGKVHVSKHPVKEEQVEREIGKFRAAVKSAMEDLNKIKESIPDDEVRKHAFIIDAHLLMLQDTYFTDDVIDIIRKQHINAEWALDMVVSQGTSPSFEKVEDPYLRERGQDLNHIYQRLIRIMVKGKESGVDAKGIRGKVIIVAHDLSPADTIQLDLNKVSGFVTDVGGRTSHTSIVARALEIPAVVGLGTVTAMVKNNDTIIMDGDEGVVIINPTAEVQKEYLAKQARLNAQRKEFLRIAKLKSETKDGFRIRVGANIELLAEMDIVERYGAEGDRPLQDGVHLPLPQDAPHRDGPLPHLPEARREQGGASTRRSAPSTSAGDKFASKIEMPKEINPAMGLRAIRLCIKEMDLFKAQLRGMLRASAYGPLRISSPWCRAWTR